MAYSKVILNDEVLMDVTQKTVTANKMLYGTTATKNDGTDIVGTVPTKSSSDLTASGATVTVPAGYYASAATKSVASGSAKTPATSIEANPSISVDSTGKVTATVSASKGITPTVTAGYVSAGTSGTVSVTGSAESQLSTQAAKTVTPTETEQTAVAAGKYTTGIVKVGAISSTYVGSDITQRSSTDLTASGATINVPAGYYAEVASKNVGAGSATAPANITGTTATVSTGTNTLTLTKSVSVTPVVTAGYVSAGTAANSTVKLTANVTTKAAGTYYPSASDQTISASQYLTGAQTIKAVATAGLTAANIKDGTTVKIGDSADDDRVASVTGTFTDASTVSSGQTAAATGQILSGYSAWVDGAEVKGSIASKTSSNLTVSGATVTAPAGYYASAASKSVATGSATAPSSISGTSASLSTGTNTLTLSKTISVTPTVTEGYVTAGTAGNSAVSLTATVTTKGAATYNTSTSDQTISSGQYLTGAQTIKAVTTAGITAANIKDGAIVKVGDANDDDRIISVTGTFTDASTVSSGQTAAAAGQILSGYSAWVDGAEVKGSIATKTSSNLSVSGATVTAPAGYYASAASKSVASMTLPTAAASSATSGYTSKATIGRSTSAQYINIPTGYNSAGAYYTISATPNGTATAPSSITGTTATVSTGTNTLTLTKTVSVTPSITTAGYISAGTAGNSSVSLTANVTTKAAATYNTSTSDQTISSGTYLTGTQTIKAVTTSNLTAANVKSGVTVKVGDANDDDRIASIAGTFTSSSTVSSGQTAAAAAQILSGYSAWVDGAEVKGSIATKTSTDLTASGATVTVPAGYYASNASKSVTTMTLPTTASSSATSGYTEKISFSGDSSATYYINIPPGYNSAGGYYKINGVTTATFPSATSSSSNAGTSVLFVNTSTSTQYLNFPVGYNGTKKFYTIRPVTTSGISAANIKSGTTIKVGDANDDDRITNVTGTFTSASTVSSGQTAAAAAQILSGYSAWVDGSEVKGTYVSELIYGVRSTTYDLNTWEGLVQLSRSGNAKQYLGIGTRIRGTYTVGSTVYDYPWIVVDFQTVELEDGTTYNNVPIIQAQYLGHEAVGFDAPELTVATETTAQAGYYYVGRSSSTYTLLSLSTGDTIPYEDYTTAVYKTPWNSVYAVRYGENCWARSNLRQYLNSTGTGWWTAQHDCDVAPSTSLNGFMTYMPSEMLSVISPIKKTTTRSTYMGSTIDTTYDKFWIASLSEMNIAPTTNYVADDGAPWAYYQQLLGDTPVSYSGTYSALIRYSCNETTTAHAWWSRSATRSSYGERSIYATGGLYGNPAPNLSYYALPACAIV